MGKRKTDEEFKKEYYNKFPDTNVKILGKYVNAKTKIECTCKKCGHNWTPTPNKLLMGRKCPKCAGNIKYDPETFFKLFHDRYPNSNVNIIGTFINVNTPIKCICKKCNFEWMPYPTTLLKGEGCAKCAGNLKYNTETFKDAFYKRFPNSNVDIIGEYKNTRTKIKCKCRICDYIWEVKPNGLMNNRSCPQCSGKIKYTTESFKEAYYKEHPDSNIEIIGDYVNNQKSIKCKCRVCGYEWTAQPQNLRNGSKCIACSGKAKYDTKSFKKKFYEKFPDATVDIIGKYTGARTRIECKCKICGYSWKPNAGNLLRGNGANCPYCYGTIKNYTTELFIKKINEKYPYNNVIIKGKYKNTKERITAECAICHKQWNPLAGDLITGKGCPYCAINKTEKSLGTFLDNLGISYTPQKKFPDCKYKKELPFDYEINDERFTAFLLEYQGEQHDHPVNFSGKNMERAEKEFEIIKKRDKIKHDYCQKTSRHLEYIWYYEEDKIQALIDLLRKYIKSEFSLDEILANAKMNKTA